MMARGFVERPWFDALLFYALPLREAEGVPMRPISRPVVAFLLVSFAALAVFTIVRTQGASPSTQPATKPSTQSAKASAEEPMAGEPIRISAGEPIRVSHYWTDEKLTFGAGPTDESCWVLKMDVVVPWSRFQLTENDAPTARKAPSSYRIFPLSELKLKTPAKTYDCGMPGLFGTDWSSPVPRLQGYVNAREVWLSLDESYTPDFGQVVYTDTSAPVHLTFIVPKTLDISTCTLVLGQDKGVQLTKPE